MKKIALGIVLSILMYLIGNWLPLKYFKPNIVDIPIEKVEYYKLLISSVSTTITFLAVLVALFKDDLREFWKFPKIVFNYPSAMTVEITSEPNNSESGEMLQATKYISRMEVYNSGNLPTMNAEIYLEKLEFTPKDSTIPQHIETSGTPIKWNGSNSESIIIPPGGKKLINIVEITAPEKTSLPDSEKTNKPPVLNIGNISNSKEKTKGKWKAMYSLYAQNHKATSFTIEIEWNGLWKGRLTEMSNYYKIEKKA
jgi:hypothetical protein